MYNEETKQKYIETMRKSYEGTKRRRLFSEEEILRIFDMHPT